MLKFTAITYIAMTLALTGWVFGRLTFYNAVFASLMLIVPSAIGFRTLVPKFVAKPSDKIGLPVIFILSLFAFIYSINAQLHSRGDEDAIFEHELSKLKSTIQTFPEYKHVQITVVQNKIRVVKLVGSVRNEKSRKSLLRVVKSIARYADLIDDKSLGVTVDHEKR